MIGCKIEKRGMLLLRRSNFTDRSKQIIKVD